MTPPIFNYGGWNVTEIGFQCSNYQFVWNSNGGKVWVKVKRMFPAGGLDPEPKIRS